MKLINKLVMGEPIFKGKCKKLTHCEAIVWTKLIIMYSKIFLEMNHKMASVVMATGAATTEGPS